MTKLSKMMLAALLIMVLFFLNQVIIEKVTRENEREKAHERTQAGRGAERVGETGSLLSRDPNAGLHPRIPGSQPELKADTQPTESSMCFKENIIKYIIIVIFGIIILILLGLFIYKYNFKKNDNKNGLLSGNSAAYKGVSLHSTGKENLQETLLFKDALSSKITFPGTETLGLRRPSGRKWSVLYCEQKNILNMKIGGRHSITLDFNRKLLGGKLNTRLPGGRHNYILTGGKKSSRLETSDLARKSSKSVQLHPEI
ncbi:uncharacterized protein LOC131834290 isoform X7 [Mustela lutreola]|uniref:uncharacterized protein LOC131834290 isoform X7 n=1 Tax=Mustela lutreola TaxID=9666 RepID=UPI0027978A91|nr:uncharacterized protein LOC131834290 isoform X7 [Mustela lutreola]